MLEEFGLPAVNVPAWVAWPVGVVVGPMLLCIAAGCAFLWVAYLYNERNEI